MQSPDFVRGIVDRAKFHAVVHRELLTAVECMVTILNDYRKAPDFDARLDSWMRAYAFLPDRARAEE